jgi:uncharacterized protein (TIGR03382 family)
LILLLAAAALAGDPTPDALPCPPPATPYIADLAATGDETSYKCLIQTDGFDKDLVKVIQEAQEGDPALPRYTRALALYLAARSDRPFNPEHVRLLNPADRRLLADGVRAHRGRKSPSPEHDAVFQKQIWYSPRPGYTDNQLSEVEKANIALADNPNSVPTPPPVEPPPVMQPAADAPSEHPASSCGCQGTPGISSVALLLLAAVAVRRREGSCRSKR